MDGIVSKSTTSLFFKARDVISFIAQRWHAIHTGMTVTTSSIHSFHEISLPCLGVLSQFFSTSVIYFSPVINIFVMTTQSNVVVTDLCETILQLNIDFKWFTCKVVPRHVVDDNDHRQIKVKRVASTLSYAYQRYATFHEMRGVSHVMCRSLTARKHIKVRRRVNIGCTMGSSSKSVDTEFDCLGSFNEDDVEHWQRHDLLHMSVFATITFTRVCRKSWSKNTRLDSTKKCVSICFYAKKWRRPDGSSKRVFSHVRTQKLCWENETLTIWRRYFRLLFVLHWREYPFVTRYLMQYVLSVVREASDERSMSLCSSEQMRHCAMLLYTFLTWRRKSANGSQRSQRRPGFLWLKNSFSS